MLLVNLIRFSLGIVIEKQVDWTDLIHDISFTLLMAIPICYQSGVFVLGSLLITIAISAFVHETSQKGISFISMYLKGKKNVKKT